MQINDNKRQKKFFILFGIHDTSAHVSINDFNFDDVILYLLPHSGEGYDGAAFAISMLRNKSRFVAARHDLPKHRDIPRQERDGTEQSVERELLENTDCLVVRFSDDAKTHVDVVDECERDANIDLTFQNILGISRFHFVFIFDEQNISIAKNLGSTGGTKIIYNGKKKKRLSNSDWPLINFSIAKGKLSIFNIINFVQFKVIVSHWNITFRNYVDRVKSFHEGTVNSENLFAFFIIQSAQGIRLPYRTTRATDGFPLPSDSLQKETRWGCFGNWHVYETWQFEKNMWQKDRWKNLSKTAKLMKKIEKKHIKRNIFHVNVSFLAFSWCFAQTDHFEIWETYCCVLKCNVFFLFSSAIWVYFRRFAQHS